MGGRREEKGKERKGGKRRVGKGGERWRVETSAIIQDESDESKLSCTDFRGFTLLQYRSVFLSSNLIG